MHIAVYLSSGKSAPRKHSILALYFREHKLLFTHHSKHKIQLVNPIYFHPKFPPNLYRTCLLSVRLSKGSSPCEAPGPPSYLLQILSSLYLMTFRAITSSSSRHLQLLQTFEATNYQEHQTPQLGGPSTTPSASSRACPGQVKQNSSFHGPQSVSLLALCLLWAAGYN